MNVLRSRARQLRKDPTDAERLLWQKLRFWQVDGFKFRRQQPLGPYIVDFTCLQTKLIIEIDGGQHMEQAEYDAKRDAWLRDQGFVILRFWNNDVLKNIDGVLEMIAKNLHSTPYLNPSPQGGRRKTENAKFPTKFGVEQCNNWSAYPYEPHLKPHRSRRHLGSGQ